MSHVRPWSAVKLLKPKKLSSYFTLSYDKLIVLQELSMNVDTHCCEKNPPLFIQSIEISSRSVEGSGDEQMMPKLDN